MARVFLINLYEVNYLGTRLLASWLRSHGHETHNMFFKDMSWEYREEPVEEHHGYQYVQRGHVVCSGYDIIPYTPVEVSLLEQAIQHFAPDIIGMSTRSPYDTIASNLVSILRSAAPEALLIAGGYGPTLRSEWYLQQGFDVVVRGDGEKALLELAESVTDLQACRNIANTSWKIGDSFIHNALHPQQKNIDVYPPPLHGDNYCSFISNNTLQEYCDPVGSPSTTFTSKATYSTFITRGCAGRCTYCSGGQWTDMYRACDVKSYKCRLRSTDAVLAELRGLDRRQFGYVDFVDECFALTKEKALYFFQKYKEQVGLPFNIYLNYEKMIKDKELFQCIVEAGLDHSDIGVQTGSENFARQYYRRHSDNNVYIEFAHMLFDSWVSTREHMIGGNCYESDDDFLATLDFIKRLPFCATDPRRNALVNVRLKMFPGTALGKMAPLTLNSPMPATEWWRRAMLMELRRIVNDDEMDMALHRQDFKQNPYRLRDYYHQRLHEKQVAACMDLLPRLWSHDVFFVGLGEQWKKNKAFFEAHGVRPSVLAVNKDYLGTLPESIDGIPVAAIEDVFAVASDTEVIVFAEEATAICRSLIDCYGMPPHHLHACATEVPLLSTTN